MLTDVIVPGVGSGEHGLDSARCNCRQASVHQEATFRALFENSTAGVAEIDAATGRFLTVNRRYCQITGRSSAELLGGLTVSDILHPDEHRVPISIAEANGDAERRYLLPDGQIAWVWISVAVTARDTLGTALRISAVVQDVTERHAVQERLEASEAMLRLSLEVGQLGCFRRNSVTGDIDCGLETRVMHGFPLGSEPISSETWLSMILPEDREPLKLEIQKNYKNRQSVGRYEYRFRHPTTGQIRYIEVRTGYEYDAQGAPLTSVGAIIDITSRREAEAQVARLAFHDALTDLPNRALFRQRLEVAVDQARVGRSAAVFYLDLDGFKDINDTHGHLVGDELLRTASHRLQAALGPTATIARIGGDEFAVIERGLTSQAGADALADRLIEALRLPIIVDGHSITVRMSVGIALAPQDGRQVDALLKAADLALYDAKAEGGGCLRYYQSSLGARVLDRRKLESDLRQAIVDGQFQLFYQPILHAESLQPVGFEALIRWNHPERGMVPPDTFIPLAEELGLIVPIGKWVLAQACADAASWPGDLKVAVNLSAVQFGADDLASTVSSTLLKSGLAPDRLELEITETVMLEEKAGNLAQLHRMKQLGVKVALDDFGTGYSSLSYVRSFPFDKLKIDKSFTRDLGTSSQSSKIMRTMLDLCAGLGMISTVEGVESHDHLEFLTAHGCSELQGYLFSPPVPVSRLSGLLETLQAARLSLFDR